MKKYLNKGLLYQWFNSAKAPIMIGIVVWGFIANAIIDSRMWRVKENIANLGSDYFRAVGLERYIFLGLIFFAIYFMSAGINKRNTTMFLSSGPYTKKQIKYNELVALLITLVLFVITYIYIAITFYIRNNELLSIVNGYPNIMCIEMIKVILFGTMGIIFMLIIDTLFSNSIMTFVGMIFIIPGSVLAILAKIFNIFNYWGIENGENLSRKIRYIIYGDNFSRYDQSILTDTINSTNITIKQLLIQIIIVLVIITIMFIIFNRAQRIYKLETATKVFSSKANEKIIVTLTCIGIGCFGNLLLLDDFRSKLLNKTGEYMPLMGIDLVKLLTLDTLCIAIIGFIAYKIIKKMLKAIG